MIADEWSPMPNMINGKYYHSLVVVKNNLCVIGHGYNPLNTVESYNVIADEWSPMPNMIKRRSGHGLVVVNSKLFVIGHTFNDSEVFDNSCKKFVSLKTPGLDVKNFYKVIPFGRNYFVFASGLEAVWCYDVDTDKWSTKYHPHNMSYYSCVKIPCWF